MRWTLLLALLYLPSLVLSGKSRKASGGTYRGRKSKTPYERVAPKRAAGTAADAKLEMIRLAEAADKAEETKTGWTAKVHSAKYIENAHESPMHVSKLPSGNWDLRRQSPGARRDPHAEGIHEPNADHVFEQQMLAKGLQKAKISWNSLAPQHQNGIKEIMNHPDNMQFVAGSINSAKAQHIRSMMNTGKTSLDKHNKDHKDKFGYMQASAPMAHHTAKELDKYLRHHELTQGNHMEKLLVDNYRGHGIRINHPPPVPKNGQKQAFTSRVYKTEGGPSKKVYPPGLSLGHPPPRQQHSPPPRLPSGHLPARKVGGRRVKS